MKKLLLSLLSLSTYTIIAQVPSKQWMNNYNGQLSSDETVTCSARDASGNLYVAGNNENYTFIAKLDANGSLLKEFKYVDSQNNEIIPKEVLVDNQGNSYIYDANLLLKVDNNLNLVSETNLSSTVGFLEDAAFDNATTPSNLVFVSSFYDTNDFTNKVKVSKFNLATATLTWNTLVHPTGNTYSNSKYVAVSGNNIYITGVTTNTITGKDALTAKLSSSGAILYTSIYNATGDQYSTKLKVNTSGDAFVVGTSDEGIAQNAKELLFLRRINSVGTASWTTLTPATAAPFTGRDSMAVIDMDADALCSKFYILTKPMRAPNAFPPYNFSPSDERHLINSTGTYVASYTPGAFTYRIPKTIKVDNSGNVFVYGNTTNHEYYLDKYNFTSNTTLFSNTYTLNTNFAMPAETLGDLHLDNSNNVYVTASKYIDAVNQHDGLAVKYNSNGLSIWESTYNGNKNASDNASFVFVNSANTFVTSAGHIENDNTLGDIVVKQFDLNGNENWSNLIDINLQDDKFLNADYDISNNLFVHFSSNTNDHYLTLVDAAGSQLFYTQLPFIGNAFYVWKPGYRSYVGNSNATGTDMFDVRSYFSDGTQTMQTSTVPFGGASSNAQAIWVDNNQNIYVLGTVTKTGVTNYELQQFNSSGAFQWRQIIPNISYQNISNEKTFLFTNSNNEVISVINNNHSTSGVGTILTRYSFGGTQVNQSFHNGQHLTSATSDGTNVYIGGTKNNSAYLAKYSSTLTNSFDYIFSNPFVGAHSDEVTAIKVGTSEIYTNSSYQSTVTNKQINLTKFDLSGVMAWQTEIVPTYTGSTINKGNSLDAKANRIYVAGSLLNSPGSETDYAVVKYCDLGTAQVLNSLATNTICANSSCTLSLNTSGANYIWSPGNQTTSSINVTQTGNYSANVVTSDGCVIGSDTLTITIKGAPATPSICAVTVDDASTHNIIQWDKTMYTDVDYFKIYREDFTNIYNVVGVVDFDSLSEFHDYSVNPNQKTVRYKISAVDNCSQESALSLYHNTIYILYAGAGQYTWNPGYTIENSANPVVQYALMRDDNNTGAWNQIATTAGTQFTIVDPNYATYPNGSWRVETIWTINCNPTRGPINTSRSNIRTNSVVGINEYNFSNDFIQLMPNPANGKVTITTGEILSNGIIEIYNMIGEMVNTQSVRSLQTTIDISNLSSGMYTVKLSDGTKSISKKLIVE